MGSVAYAGETRPNGLADCPCQIGPDGVSRDCNGTVCTDNPSAIKTENRSANQATTSRTAPGALSVLARALLSVISILALS